MGRMKLTYIDIIKVIPAMVCLLSASSCADSDNGGDNPELRMSRIVVNTMAVGVPDDVSAIAGGTTGDDTFTLLLWRETYHLDPLSGYDGEWIPPYLSVHAPQSVISYRNSVFDTNYNYPAPSDTYLYATGYAPATVLKPDNTDGYSNYRKLVLQADAPAKGRYDFMSCDMWNEVYRGSLSDPFSQDKNKLYFRHLAAKLIFYADRERETMENKQFVRNVQIRNLYMSIDNGKSWESMYTPGEFTWKELVSDDITSSYRKVINKVLATAGNANAAGTAPRAGYKATASEAFAGGDGSFVLERKATDRVPIDGMYIDSCYVCNPIGADGKPIIGDPIRLKMDISAEMSFDRNFPKPDGESVTDDMTFTRVWTNVELPSIYKVNESGVPQSTTISQFLPGNEYRIFIHFSRTGVYLVARELPWNVAGSHYITISGGDQQQNP